MKLHENNALLHDAILATSQLLKIPEIYIEKDYWVTVALFQIFNSDMANSIVFKGGTALSKCHKLIDRFSEDIDLVVTKNFGESDNQLKNKIRAICKIVGAILPEIYLEGVTNKRGNIRKTAHQYSKIYSGDFGQVREHIIVEATWLGNFEPSTQELISSSVSDMMKTKGQENLIEEYNLHPFAIQVLSKERTFCEKIMSLVRFSRQGDPYKNLSNKIRHIYDVHMMLKNEQIKFFFENGEFDKMIVKVGQDDFLSYKNNNSWLQEHPAKALIFEKPELTWENIKTTYRTTFKELVFGEIPDETSLINTLILISKRLTLIKWTL